MKKLDWKPHPLALASVALLILTFHPFRLSLLSFLALIPWFFLLVRASKPREALLQSFWIGFLFSIFTFSWVAGTVREFGQTNWVVGGLALMGFGCIGQPQFLIAALPLRSALKRLNTHPMPVLQALGLTLTIALFYAGLDWILPKLFVDTLGYAAVHWDQAKQIADIGAPPLLTFGMVLMNVAIFDLWTRMKNRGEPTIWGALKVSIPLLLVPAVFWGAAILYGSNRLALVAERIAHPLKKSRVAVIQANIGNIDKLASEIKLGPAARKVLGAYYDVSDEAVHHDPKPDFIVWPETAYPSYFRGPENQEEFLRDQELESYARTRNVSVVFGGYDVDRNRLSYNTLFYLEPNGNLQTYHKTILLTFGEYIPGADFFPWIKDVFPMIGYFGRGPGPVSIPVAGVKTNPIICYEGLFPNFTATAVRNGAEMILNVTNDSWFGELLEPYFHFDLTTFRSIETRTPLVRATNTGFTALIQPDGSVVNRGPLSQPAALFYEVPIIEPIPTLIKAWGDWFGWVAFGLGLLGLIAFYRKSKARR